MGYFYRIFLFFIESEINVKFEKKNCTIERDLNRNGVSVELNLMKKKKNK